MDDGALYSGEAEPHSTSALAMTVSLDQGLDFFHVVLIWATAKMPVVLFWTVPAERWTWKPYNRNTAWNEWSLWHLCQCVETKLSRGTDRGRCLGFQQRRKSLRCVSGKPRLYKESSSCYHDCSKKDEEWEADVHCDLQLCVIITQSPLINVGIHQSSAGLFLEILFQITALHHYEIKVSTTLLWIMSETWMQN